MKIVVRLIGVFSLALMIVSCATPSARLNQEAMRLGFNRSIVQGAGFKHVVYTNKTRGKSDELHVYLDGDGTPWINNRWVAEDPTPRNPLLFQLMSLDAAPAVYLGRPCYHGFSDIPPCNPGLWTNERYSMVVIKTMAVALEQILNSLRTQRVVLIGYSGGGTLAMLMAGQIKNLQGIVTIAGNLDIEAWSSLHGYEPLIGSKNPARQQPLNPTLSQLHLAGGKDQNVPVSLIQPTVLHQHSARLVVIPEFDHACCWEKVWPSVLNDIRSYAQKPEPLMGKTLRSERSN
jgi:pimeloyl-ACP methyl ester carboxylesterase